jgi:hypothetical protein
MGESLNFGDEDADETDQLDNHDGESENVEHGSEDISKRLHYMTQRAHSQSIELCQAECALDEAIKKRGNLKKELHDLKFLYGQASVSSLANKSLAELTSLQEKVIVFSRSYYRDERRIYKKIEEERTCVIRRENPKTVMLSACRHIFVCSECGQREELDRCPLCREIILEQINVYS